MASNKYTRLMSNTVLFGISNFSGKILSFLLTRLYTEYLSTGSFGAATNVQNAAQLLIPLVSLGMANAVIRFGLEKDFSKTSVFSNGLVALGAGFGLMLVLAPLINLVSVLSGYVIILYIFVLVSCLRNLFSQFVRAKMHIKLYAVDGLLDTAYTLGFNILFIVKLNLGATGYLLSIICADLLSALGLFIVARLWQHVDFRHLDKGVMRTMLQYALPLVPATMFWWVTSNSDTFYLTYMLSAGAAGLYSAATRIPNLLSLLSTLFTEAWQLSAFTDGQEEGRDHFFSTIYNALASTCFIMGGGLILFTRFIMKYLVGADYGASWQYVPFLVLAIIFSTLSVFLNSIYMVERKSKLSLYTMMAGAVVNLVLNYVCIRAIGINGAGLATFISYLVIFVLRAVNTRKLIRIKLSPLRTALNTLLLFLQSLLLIGEITWWPLWCALILAVLVVLNGVPLVKGLIQLVQRRNKSK